MRTLRSFRVALACSFVAASSPAFAATYLVPDDFDTIQEAIDVAEDGDLIEVLAGLYVENIDFLGKTIAVVAIDGPDETVINGSALTAGDEYGSCVRFSGGEGEGTVLEGFKLIEGTGTQSTSSLGLIIAFGGGIYSEEAEASIVNCVIDGNAEGGIYAVASDLEVTDTEITGNIARGGIQLHAESTLTLSNSLIFDNHAPFAGGGGLTVSVGCSAVVEDCDISDNTALFAGAMIITGDTEVVRTVMTGNEGIAGGALVGGTTDEPVVSFTDCEFRDNLASAGGAILLSAGGGSVTVDLSLERCLIVGNDAVQGGALFGEGHGEIAEVMNCTIANNTAGEAGAIRIRSTPDPSTVEFELTNCIVWNNGIDALDEGGGAINATYSTIEDGWTGTGNIELDPEFVEPLAGNYELGVDSPCIDAGSPSTFDIDGTVADQGALAVMQGVPFRRGDVDGNGVVDGCMDALYLLTWRFAQGEAPPCMDAADADDNGEVWILTDSYTLLQYGFTFGPPPPDPGPFNCGIDPDAAGDELDCEDAGDCL